jgi:hypothetical protein
LKIKKKLADAGKPPVVIPIIVVAVDIHIALVIIPVECGILRKNIFCDTAH